MTDFTSSDTRSHKHGHTKRGTEFLVYFSIIFVVNFSERSSSTGPFGRAALVTRSSMLPRRTALANIGAWLDLESVLMVERLILTLMTVVNS